MTQQSVAITVDGERVIATSGISVAAALLNSGETMFRTSVTGEPRGPLCGMGTCFECRVTIDGVSKRRACMVTVTDGMVISRDV